MEVVGEVEEELDLILMDFFDEELVVLEPVVAAVGLPQMSLILNPVAESDVVVAVERLG